MFTGIVKETGKIKYLTKNSVIIECNSVLKNAELGDSIAVNGVCLTVTALSPDSFSADISDETYNITTFKNLKINDFVNLETAMKLQDTFGGHIVTGHIDGTGVCKSLLQKDKFYNIMIEVPEHISKYIIKKGSVTINGISLTVAEIDADNIKLAIIPHTFENTNLKYLKKGDYVNIETDVLAKYVEKFLSTSDNKSRINPTFLRDNGFY